MKPCIRKSHFKGSKISNFLISMSLEPDGLNLWYFKCRLSKRFQVSYLKYQRSTTLGCKDRGIKNQRLF